MTVQRRWNDLLLFCGSSSRCARRFISMFTGSLRMAVRLQLQDKQSVGRSRGRGEVAGRRSRSRCSWASVRQTRTGGRLRRSRSITLNSASGGSCTPNPDTSSRPASNAPDPRRSDRASDRPTPRSSRQTGPPTAVVARAPPARRQPQPGQRPPAPRLVITPNQHRRLAERPTEVIRLKDLHDFLRFLHGRPPGRALTTTRARVPTPQDRTAGGNRRHP